MESVQIVAEDYRGWPNTYRLSNGVVEVRVVTDIGPRIIDVRRAGGPNLLYVRQSEVGKSGEPDWVFRGGWRLWVAPERRETTYDPDNAPCFVAALEDGVRVTGPTQPTAGIRKQVEVRLNPGEPRVSVRSTIKNVSDTSRTYAAWSLPVLRPGGRAFVPLDKGPLDSFDAVRRLILWSYTDPTDPRYLIGDRLIRIDHAKVTTAPPSSTGRRRDESKIGVDSTQGWAAYLLDGTLFLERFPYAPGAQYPDGGATIEVYSSAEFLELEHLGPLTTIEPGGELVFPEDWWLFPDVAIPTDEAGAIEALDRYVRQGAGPV